MCLHVPRLQTVEKKFPFLVSSKTKQFIEIAERKQSREVEGKTWLNSRGKKTGNPELPSPDSLSCSSVIPTQRIMHYLSPLEVRPPHRHCLPTGFNREFTNKSWEYLLINQNGGKKPHEKGGKRVVKRKGTGLRRIRRGRRECGVLREGCCVWLEWKVRAKQVRRGEAVGAFGLSFTQPVNFSRKSQRVKLSVRQPDAQTLQTVWQADMKTERQSERRTDRQWVSGWGKSFVRVRQAPEVTLLYLGTDSLHASQETWRKGGEDERTHSAPPITTTNHTKASVAFGKIRQRRAWVMTLHAEHVKALWQQENILRKTTKDFQQALSEAVLLMRLKVYACICLSLWDGAPPAVRHGSGVLSGHCLPLILLFNTASFPQRILALWMDQGTSAHTLKQTNLHMCAPRSRDLTNSKGLRIALGWLAQNLLKDFRVAQMLNLLWRKAPLRLIGEADTEWIMHAAMQYANLIALSKI